MPSDFLWYGLIANDSLEQGDFFFSCPVMEPIAPPVGDSDGVQTIQAIGRVYDVLIISQSCDLVKGKIETVLVCPVFPIEEIEKLADFFRFKDGKESIRRGNVPGLHMLAACNLPGFASPIRVATFRQVFGLPFEYVRYLARSQSPRLRLLPPYREHLAQAFARFIMRVGLPVDIPSFS